MTLQKILKAIKLILCCKSGMNTKNGNLKMKYL